MKIKKVQVLNGPNIWSIKRQKLIQMRLDIEEMEQRPTNTINGFYDRIRNLLPSLYDHRCSEGVPGGFFNRVSYGTWMGHVIEHIALEIQCLAGMETGFGRTRETEVPGTYNVVFSFIDEEAGLYAARAAVGIAQSLVDAQPYDLEKDIENLKELYRKNALGPSTRSIVEEAISRNIPWFRLNDASFIQLGYGAKQRRIEATVTDATSHISVETACDKALTKKLLTAAHIPTPQGEVCTLEEELECVAAKLGFPLVIKPIDGNQGKGASVNIGNITEARKAFSIAKQYSTRVIVEQFIPGFDFRILVVNYKVVAAAKRIPAHVIGNGKHTVLELIEQLNNDPRRGEGHEKVLTQIVPDSDTHRLLAQNNLSLDAVPGKGVFVQLKSTANLSTGATSEDVTDTVHPDNIRMAEKISRIIGLDICGIDIMALNLFAPLQQHGGAVLEVNAAPGFRMHLNPGSGIPRNVAAPVVDMLFPDKQQGRIPIVSVTGTNGKTTTARLLAHMATVAGFKTGLTTSDGIYIQNELVEKGDTTGPLSANFVLKDPTVEFAVLETARGGILRAGLGFDRCDTGIITNIAEDHLGIDGICSLSDLAKVKSVVVESVKEDGWAVLNADDAYCMKIAEQLECNKAYFSLDPGTTAVQELIDANHIVAFLQDGCIVISRGKTLLLTEAVAEIPLTLGGKALFMVQNVLAACLAAYLQGFGPITIQKALRSFMPGPRLTPGRLNIFDFEHFRLMIDFAHNPAGYRAVSDYLAQTDAAVKIGIIAGVGDRRDEDITACGCIAAQMFNHIIIRQEQDLRGRTEQQITELLLKGIAAGNRSVTYEVIPDEKEALKHAVLMATPGSYIVAFSDAVSEVLSYVQSLHLPSRIGSKAIIGTNG